MLRCVAVTAKLVLALSLLGATAHAAQLRLDFSLEPYTVHNNDPSVVLAKVRSISFVDDNGKRRWSVPPPKGLASFLTQKAAATTYLADPKATLDSLGLMTGTTLVREKEIVLYAREHLWVFAASDGRLLFDVTQGVAGFGALGFRHADVTFRCGSESATRTVAMEPFLIGCGDRVLLYFVQGFTVYSTAPWKRLHSEMFPDVPRKWSYSVADTTLTLKRID